MEESDDPHSATQAITHTARIIGSYTREKPGPVFVLIGGLHGNEPEGVKAIERVFNTLNSRQIPCKGEIHGFIGHTGAYDSNQRYIDKDLNRIWTRENLMLVRSGLLDHDNVPVEMIEMQELFNHFQHVVRRDDEKVFVMDLHATAAESPPFFVLGDTLRNRLFAHHLPVPVVLGIEEQVEGTISSLLNDLGYICVTFEAGRQGDEKTIELHEAAIWVELVTSGCLREEDVPGYRNYVRQLSRACKGLPRVFESVYHYLLRGDESFVMEPGFANFARIRKNQVLGCDKNGPVRATKSGYLFAPLYQKQGSEGFFILQKVHPFWLWLSYRLRKMQFDRFLPLLPGIHRHPERKDTMVVNTRVARLRVTGFFHLLGYRKVRKVRHLLFLTRRKHDLHGRRDPLREDENG